jgi:hypothetical protein
MIIFNTFVKKYKFELIIFILSLILSSWLMFSTFSYDNGFMQISTKAWSDFASHIPLIRSFSFGENFPPQYPLFLGPIIKYHFLFYAFVGFLEKGGIRIDYALNIPSILGFSFLILIIFVFSKNLFKSKAVGLLSVCFFLFNSSLDFINFFIKHPLSINTLTDIVTNKTFPSFGPYDGKIISAFGNLNIYTNQRHLALSYGVSLLLIFLILKTYKTKRISMIISLLLGLILGLSFLLNIAVFIMTVIVLSLLFLFFKEKRVYLLICLLVSLIIALPQYLFTQSTPSFFKPGIYLGYLVNNLSFSTFINYWVQNLGISVLLIPVAFLISDKNAKKIFLSFFSLFIIGNIIQFAPEIAANHKFFNYFIILANMFSAFLIISLWNKKFYFKVVSIILIILMTLTGVIDLFPIYNDSKINIADYPVNKDVYWIMKNTSPNANFLNTAYLYDNASIAGRKIFIGWPYFAWSQGYDTFSRDNLRKSLLRSNNLTYFCDNISKYKLDYAEINTNIPEININIDFFNKNFPKVYQNTQNNFSIYSLNKCK